MAVEKVKKVMIAGLADDFEAISKKLQRLSMLHINQIEEAEDIAKGDGGASFEQADSMFARITSTMEFMKQFSFEKRGMLEAKPELDEDGLDAIDDAKIIEICEQAEACEADIAKLRSRSAQIENTIAQLLPYISVDVPLSSIRASKYAVQYLGNVQEIAVADMEAALSEAGAYVQQVGGDSDSRYYYIAAYRDNEEAVREALRSAGFADANLSVDGVPRDVDRQLRDELQQIGQERIELDKRGNEIAKHMGFIEMAQDKYTILRDRYQVAEETAVTGQAFVLDGWVRERHMQKLEAELTKIAPELCIEFYDPEEDEIPPTAIRNKKLIRPFEAVLNMYSTPQYTEMDPTFIMTPFFFCFFGMMVSDAGYGILLTIGALFFMKKAKPTGMFGQIVSIVFLGGISTVIWGALYGGWFGIADIKPIWFAPLQDPIKMIVLCIVLGMLQLSVGLLAQAYESIRKGRVIDAICDDLFVLMTIIGGPLIVVLPEVAAMKYIALVGVAGLFLTAGRDRKGIIGKFMGGFSALYGLTGYLSDALSYTRLFGMGMATGVIAMVFNTIAGMMMSGIGWVFAIIILLVGHVFNIAINALGAYVHSCRLQYIEFFSKFFEGGGRAFVPFGYKTRYINVKR